jgi:peptide/nickel transport system ATP-binding protein
VTPVLEAQGLRRSYRGRGRAVVALDGVDIAIGPGETLGVVGPSGSGKSTLARLVMALEAPDAGRVRIEGRELGAMAGAELRRLRRRWSMVFQDPLAAFNPRATVAGVIDDPLRIHAVAPRAERPARIAELLARVGLPEALMGRAIHEISGGQRQRVALARALATGPALIVLDEAVSALDASVRAEVLRLLVGLQRAEGIAYLFISHDLAAVGAVAHRLAIMEAGRIVESGPARAVIAAPRSAVGRALVAAVPRLRGARHAGPAA